MSRIKANVDLQIPNRDLVPQIRDYLESQGVELRVNKAETVSEVYELKVVFRITSEALDIMGTPTKTKVLRPELLPHTDEFAYFPPKRIETGEINPGELDV